MNDSQQRLWLTGGIALIVLAVIVLAPLLPMHDVTTINVPQRFAPPSLQHWLGLDNLGRDVFARVIDGTRASLSIAAGAAAIAAVIGTALGLIGGYFRGLTEILAVRSTEAILCLPPLLLALLVVTLLGAGMTTLIIALSILFVPAYVRVAFAATLQVRSLDYVTAQQSLGVHPARILARTVLPNIMPPMLVQFSLTVASAIVLESGLSFLGLGVVPPEPSLGLMIRAARGALDAAPMLIVWPSLALTGTVFLFNRLCDGLRDAIDPHGVPRGAMDWLWVTAAARRPELPSAQDAISNLLEVRCLDIALGGPAGVAAAPRLVRDVSLSLNAGETLVLVGESGSGKTLTALAIMGLLPAGLRASRGEVLFRDKQGATRQLLRETEAGYRPLRGREISMVFQDPSSGLDPVQRIGDQVAEVIRAHRSSPARETEQQVIDVLKRVGLPDPERRVRSYPHELSGGQRQRVMLALALANGPRVLIADEPTTALDPTVQLQILQLLDGLKRSGDGLGTIFVTHDLAVAAEIADRICVMYAGEIVEQGPATEVFEQPRHPYTVALLGSMPAASAGELTAIPGQVPGLSNRPNGCRFAPRCGHAAAPCAAPPAMQAVDVSRHTRCVRWQEVT